MSVTADAFASSSGGTATLTYSHTVGNKPNRALVVGVGLRGNFSVNTIAYAGLPVTIAASGVDTAN